MFFAVQVILTLTLQANQLNEHIRLFVYSYLFLTITRYQQGKDAGKTNDTFSELHDLEFLVIQGKTRIMAFEIKTLARCSASGG